MPKRPRRTKKQIKRLTTTKIKATGNKLSRRKNKNISFSQQPRIHRAKQTRCQHRSSFIAQGHKACKRTNAFKSNTKLKQ